MALEILIYLVVKYVEDNFKDKLKKNDVLFNNTNSPKLAGKNSID